MFNILIVSLTVGTFSLFVNSVCGEEAESIVNLPDIALERYMTEESKKYITPEYNLNTSVPSLISKYGNDYFVKPEGDISYLLLTCRASYPTYWVMTDVQSTDLSGVDTNSEAFFGDAEESDWTNIVPHEFISYLRLYNTVTSTGLYTCRSVHDDKLAESTYVFLPGLNEAARTLIYAGNELEIGLNGLDTIIIPCKISQKYAEVSITRLNRYECLPFQSDGRWAALNLSKGLDPKQGFTIHKNEVDSLFGSYKCSADGFHELRNSSVAVVSLNGTDEEGRNSSVVPSNGTDEELLVNVVEDFFNDKKFPLKDNQDGTASWEFRRRGAGIQCCSNSTVSPDLFVVTCENAPDCEMKKRIFMNLSPKITSNTEGLRETSKKYKPCTYTTVYTFLRPFIMQCTGSGIDVWGQFSAELDYPNIDKVKFVPSTSMQNMTYKMDTSVRVKVYRVENVTNGYGESSLKLTQINLNEVDLHSGDRFIIDCCGMHYNHAIGRMQRIVWKNGTKTKVATPEKERYDPDRQAYLMDFCFNYIYDDEMLDEYIQTADENMSHFECIVPRWNEKKPTVLRIEMNIKVPMKPVFASSEEIVNVTYNENQLGILQLDCKLLAGAPPPQMVWTKDGYELNQTDLYWSVVTENKQLGSNVLFMRAVKNIEGEFECTAENQEGSCRKRFFVKVNPRSYLDYWIALVVFGGFFAVIICCALRISTLEKQTVPKQVQPITFSSSDN